MLDHHGENAASHLDAYPSPLSPDPAHTCPPPAPPINSGLRSLLARLLSLDPRQRPTAAEVLACSWVSAPPITPPTSSLRAALPSWPSSDDLSAEHQRQQQQHRRRQQQEQQHHHHHEQQEQQTPAPVTPTEIENHDDALVLRQHADSATHKAEATAPGAGAARAGSFGFPGQEGLFLDAAEAAAASAATAAVAATASPTLAAIERSPIRSRHRRSKKRKSPEAAEEEAAATASVVQDRSTGFVLEHHAGQGQEQDESFSPEMSALGAILNSSNGGRGGGKDDAGGERPTKIARVSPSPLTLPAVMKAPTASAPAAAAELHGDGQDRTSEFSGLGTQQGLLEFLKPPPATTTRVRQSGRRQRAARRAKATRPVANSARAAAAASGSIWEREAVTGSEQEGTRAAAGAAAASFTTISFTLGERGEWPTE